MRRRTALSEEISLTREEVARSREVTQRVFSEMRQFMQDERNRANKVLEPLIASHNELIAEIKVQREGLRALIDRLNKGGEQGQAPA
jgi:hypothetical protein